MDFLTNMDLLQKTFWYLAIPSSLIFVLQTLFTFIGVELFENDIIDTDVNNGFSSFELFSFRNLINFMIGFSWSGIALFNTIPNSFLLILTSFLIGVSFIYSYFFIILQIYKLNEDNSFKIESTLMQTGEVYLTIPEKMSGKGKILLTVKGSLHELDAMTESELLTNGAIVVVVRIENNILVVEPI